MSSCAEYVGGGRQGVMPCPNPAKGEHDGRPLCGVHLRAVNQRAASRQRYEEKREKDRAEEARASRAIDALAERGIKATAYYRTLGPLATHGYTGAVVVDSDDLLALLSTDEAN